MTVNEARNPSVEDAIKYCKSLVFPADERAISTTDGI